MTPPARPRRRLPWLLDALALLCLVAALRLLVLAGTEAVGISRYQQRDYAAATSWFTSTRVVPLVEPWKPAFNTGAALDRAGRNDEAKAAYAEALELVPEPHRCRVVLNYSWLLEREADQASSRGRNDEATLRLDQAHQLLAGVDCSTSADQPSDQAQQSKQASGSAEQQRKEAAQRVEKKQQAASKKQGGSQGTSSQPKPEAQAGSGDQDEQQNKQQELQRRQEAAQSEAAKQKYASRGGTAPEPAQKGW